MILRAIVGEEVVGRRLDDPGPYSMLEVLTPTMIDYARPELAAEMVPLLLSRTRNLVPGLLRTRLGQRPGLADHPRRAARRRLGCQRPEGVDEFRAVRGAVRPAHPHRSAGHPESSSHHRVLRRHGHPRHHRAAAAHDARRRRVLRGLLRRRGRARRPHARTAPATAGSWRWTCCPTNARPASGSESPTCTRGSTR